MCCLCQLRRCRGGPITPARLHLVTTVASRQACYIGHTWSHASHQLHLTSFITFTSLEHARCTGCMTVAEPILSQLHKHSQYLTQLSLARVARPLCDHFSSAASPFTSALRPAYIRDTAVCVTSVKLPFHSRFTSLTHPVPPAIWPFQTRYTTTVLSRLLKDRTTSVV